MGKLKSGRVMIGLQKILRKLSALGLLRTQQIEPQHVGTPLNRDGFGISAQQVHQLLDDIVSIGFDAREPNAICCDVDGSDDSVYRLTWLIPLGACFQKLKGISWCTLLCQLLMSMRR